MARATIRTLLVLEGLALIVLPLFLMFPGMPVWFGVALIVGQWAGFGSVLFGATSRCWEA